MLSLSLISITAYITATLLKSKPIYESLLERLLSGRNESIYDGENIKGGKVLMNHAVQQGSAPEGKTIGEITWQVDVCLWQYRGEARNSSRGEIQGFMPGIS